MAWLIWGLAATFYFADYMARVAPSVMHHYLQIDFGMNETAFATLTASFYLPYIIMQIPVGIIVDRISVRFLLTLMALITAVGCVIFGLSNGLLVASISRVLIGFSAAFAFTSALRLATSWFPPAMLGLLAGLTQALGMLGASAGQAPLSYLVSVTGWRYSMFAIAILFVTLAILIFKYIKDHPLRYKQQAQPNTSQKISILEGLKIVLSSPQTWINGLYAGCLYAPTAVIGESLGPAFLQYGYKIQEHAAAFAIGLIFIGWVIGGPIAGWLSDRAGRRKPFMILSALCGIILSTLFVFYPEMNKTNAYVICFLFGLTNTGVAIAYAVSTEIHSRMVVGTAIAFTNMMSILVGATLQPCVGRLIDLISHDRSYDVSHLLLTDFQYGFRLLPLSSLLALILACMVKETYCRGVNKKD
jgi:MFS family permease